MRPTSGFLCAIAATFALSLTGIPAAAANVEGSSDNDAPQGASALRLFAAAQGHPVEVLRGSTSLPPPGGLLLVLQPGSPYDVAEAQALVRWVAAGGSLVYAGQADAELDRALGLRRSPVGVSVVATATFPAFPGVQRLTGEPLPGFVEPSATQVVTFRPPFEIGASQAVGIEQARGSGRLFAFSDATPLENSGLGVGDNGRLAADLVAAVPLSAPVRFDDRHHQADPAASSSWLETPWGGALALEIFVLLLVLAVRGRRFGSLLAIGRPGQRSAIEYTAAVGSLLRRSRARPQALAVLRASARRAVLDRVGLREGAPGEVDAALRLRAPGLAESLAAAEAAAATARNEVEFTHASSLLHQLALPEENLRQ
ncbi:MAG: DUF4350 domain-containing protein [Candidatus Dormibacteria bacterium]